MVKASMRRPINGWKRDKIMLSYRAAEGANAFPRLDSIDSHRALMRRARWYHVAIAGIVTAWWHLAQQARRLARHWPRGLQT